MEDVMLGYSILIGSLIIYAVGIYLSSERDSKKDLENKTNLEKKLDQKELYRLTGVD